MTSKVSFHDSRNGKTYEYDKLEKIPKEISRSQREWIDPPEYKKEVLNFKPEKDPNDEMALRANFVESNPPVEVVRRRAVYRPHRYMILVTYGPTSMGKFDIESDVVGFEFFGCFETPAEVAHQIEAILEYNPHAVFLTFHVLDVGTGKRVQLPPPNDGSAMTSHLNREHNLIMSRHLKKQVQEAESVENRVKDSIEDAKERNAFVKAYNQKLVDYAKKILNVDGERLTKEREQARNQIYNTYKEMSEDHANIALPMNVGGKSIMDQIKTTDIKSLVHDQVEDYLNLYKKLNKIPDTFRYEYKILKKDGKEYLVRSLQSIE